MKRFYAIVVLALVFGLAPVLPVLAEVIDAPIPPAPITVTVGISGSTSLAVTTCNISDDAAIGPALNFSGIGGRGLPPAGNPWVVSDQYIRIQYSSNYGSWGIRIVTDNEDLEGDANDTIDSIAGSDIDPSPAVTTLAYSGLLSLSEIRRPIASQDPSKRAPWAWQVFGSTRPAVTSPTSLIGASGALADGTTIGDWDDDWIYIADKNDEGYTGDILVDADSDGQRDDLNYGMIVVGSGPGGGGMAQHPAAAGSPHPRRPGDGDIAVYIAARFANTNWGDPAAPTPTPYLLGADDYSATLYVELVHE